MTTLPVPDNERLARIEDKLDQSLASHADHEIRISRLERALWMVSAFLADVSRS